MINSNTSDIGFSDLDSKSEISSDNNKIDLPDIGDLRGKTYSLKPKLKQYIDNEMIRYSLGISEKLYSKTNNYVRLKVDHTINNGNLNNFINYLDKNIEIETIVLELIDACNLLPYKRLHEKKLCVDTRCNIEVRLGLLTTLQDLAIMIAWSKNSKKIVRKFNDVRISVKKDTPPMKFLEIAQVISENSDFKFDSICKYILKGDGITHKEMLEFKLVDEISNEFI